MVSWRLSMRRGQWMTKPLWIINPRLINSRTDLGTTSFVCETLKFIHDSRTINETVGACGAPKIGWQIDPFGHSREQASIFAQLGFDGVFLGRLDYNDHNQRNIDKTMEVIWQGSANLENTNIFTYIMPDMYGPPPGYCFDIECGDEVIVDDDTSPDYNVPRRVDEFVSKMLSLASNYRTNHVLIPMGGDFQFQSAEKNYINIDKLIA